MTTDDYSGHSLTGADLVRAAGIEKMARAIHLRIQGYECEESPPHRHWMRIATAALAAWEAHLKTQKAPAD